MPLRPKIVLFGDSITQFSFSVGGWGARVAALFARKVGFKKMEIEGNRAIVA